MQSNQDYAFYIFGMVSTKILLSGATADLGQNGRSRLLLYISKNFTQPPLTPCSVFRQLT